MPYIKFVASKKFLYIVTLIFCASCYSRFKSISQDTLFSLDIGKMENEFYLNSLPQNSRVVRDNYINQNGLFYISNSHMNKVMVFSPFGDLITLFYDPIDNPSPVVLSSQHDNDMVSNLNGYSHDFTNIGLICSNKKNHLFIEDELNSSLSQLDAKTGVLYNRVIKWFDNNGNYLNYIGQEGIGGTPFSHVSGLYMSSKDRLSVVCREQNIWKIFIYDSEGFLLHSIRFEDEKMPWNAKDFIFSSEDVLVNYNCNKILVKVNFYERNYIGGDGHVNFINFSETEIWIYDIGEAKFTSHFFLPKKFIQIENYNSHLVLYDLIGQDKYNKLYFIAPHQDDRYDLIVVNFNGKTVDKIRLSIDKNNLYFNQFYVSEEGVVSAMLGYEEGVNFYQWKVESPFKKIRR